MNRPPQRSARYRVRTLTAMGLSAALLAALPASAAATVETDTATSAPTSNPADETPAEATDETIHEAAAEATPDEAPETEGEIVDLQVLSINDFHGRLERDGAIAGVEILGCSVDVLRAQNPHTLFVGAGDHIGASTFTSWATDDEASIEALNLMGMDLSSVGNHEFDRGWPDLRDRVIPQSDFTWLGANAVDSSTGEPILAPYEIQEVGGLDVAFIGLNTPDMPRLVSPAGIAGIEWRDLDSTANYWADHIAENEDVDLTMVLVHEGINGTSLDQAQGQIDALIHNADEDISAIITGHTHRAYAEQTEAGVWVTQTGEYTQNLGQLNISVDTETGEIVDSSAQVLPLIDENDEPVYCNAGDRPDLAALVDDAVTTAEEVGNEVIGTADAGFARAQNASGGENRSARSTMSDLIADAQAWAARQSANEVDFAVMNPGGVRADLPPGTEGAGGEVTFRDLATIQPFGNLINSVSMTGAEFKEALELQWREGRDLMLGISSEFSYTYDPSQPHGERVTGMWLNGEPMDLNASYLLAANSFLAEGGDGFTPFAENNLGTTGQVDMDGFISYFQQGRDGELEIEPNLAKRSVALTWESASDAVYASGDEIAFDVSSLAWNTPGLPDPESAEVTLAGAEVGSFDVDTSWPDAGIGEDNDLRGSAEIRIEVPENIATEAGNVPSDDAGMPVPLVITEPETGLEVSLLVTLDSAVLQPGEDAVNDPTATPSADPGGDASTGAPTDEPATDPSVDHSGDPTVEPTTEATTEATTEPSTGPSTGPQGDPTGDAADGPSDDPTDSPTVTSTTNDDGDTTANDRDRDEVLATTGATIAAIAGLALLLLVLGGALLVIHRRRQNNHLG